MESDLRRETGALLDRAFGVELSSDVGTADDMRDRPGGRQLVHEITYRLLASAHNDGVHGQRPRTLVIFTERDVQTIVVDALVVHLGQLVYALGCKRGPVHPTGRLGEPGADPALLALQQVDLAR